MIIRELTSADDAAYRLTIASAWDWPTDRTSATDGLGTPGSESAKSRFGVFEGERMTSAFTVCEHITAFEGRWITTWDLEQVATRPDHRRSGCIRATFDALFPLMRENGISLAALMPFSFPFYRQFGYEEIYRVCTLTLPLDRLTPCRRYSGGAFLLEDDAGLRELDEFYTAFALQTNMATRRDRTLWEKIAGLAPTAQPKFTYCFRNADGRVSGYLTYQPKKTPELRRMEIGEFVYSDLATLRAMLAFLSTFSSHYDTARIIDLPLFLDFHPALDDFAGTAHETRAYKMLRVVDAAKALELKRYPAHEGSFTVYVEDTLEWNRGGYTVSFGGKDARVVKNSLAPHECDLAVKARMLSRLLAGSVAITDPKLALFEGLELNSNRALLADIFTERPIYQTDFY